ncbi:hypothetical protein V2J09_006490 [Rumex salicifolius]
MKGPAPAPAVADFVTKEVVDWEDEVKSTARFKAFSGQRSDWEPQFRFWRDLILKISLQFRLLIISPYQVRSWFNRGGLVPLCLDHVLLEMYKAGDLVRFADLGDPTSGRLSQLLTRVVRFAGVLTSSTANFVLDDQLIVVSTLEDKTASIMKTLSDCHWTSTCIVSRGKFEELCRGNKEASIVERYMYGRGRVKYLSVKKNELIEGFKVSLFPDTIINITSLDHDNLLLVWTAEKLQRQLDVLDLRYEMSRKSALASLKEGNKRAALRHARALKLTTESREKILLLMDRVDEVSEAIQVANQAMKENRLDIEQLEQSLQDLGEAAYTQEQIHDALGSSLTYAGADYDDIEEELKEMELQEQVESSIVQPPKSFDDEAVTETEPTSEESADLLAEAISGLKLADGNAASSTTPLKERSKAELETA